MSEHKLPPAWGILRIDDDLIAKAGETEAAYWWDDICNDGEYAQEKADDCGTPESPAYVVELIDREQVARLIAEAVTAERERLIAKIRASEAKVPFLLAKSAADFVHAKMIDELRIDAQEAKP